MNYLKGMHSAHCPLFGVETRSVREDLTGVRNIILKVRTAVPTLALKSLKLLTSNRLVGPPQSCLLPPSYPEDEHCIGR